MSTHTVLIVDGDRDTRAIYTAALQHSGVRVLCASDGARGLELASSELPDLVVTEVFVPLVDGITLARHLKRDARTRHIPVLVITSTPALAADPPAPVSSFDGYLVKPCTPSRLIRELQRHLGPLEGSPFTTDLSAAAPTVPVQQRAG